jgi:hypothetical protein
MKNIQEGNAGEVRTIIGKYINKWLVNQYNQHDRSKIKVDFRLKTLFKLKDEEELYYHNLRPIILY